MSQTSYTAQNVIAFEGMVAYGHGDFITKKNATRQLTSVVFTAVNSATYVLVINGTAFSITADGSTDATEIRDAMKIAIDAGSEPVVVETLSTNGLLIESTDRDNDFTITNVGSDTPSNVVITELVAQGQQIPFGRAVCWDDRGADDECRLPRQSADVGDRIFGVAAADHLLETVTGATNGLYLDKAGVSILRRGYIWVVCESAITAIGADVYVRYASGSGGSNLGAFRADADTSTAAVLNGATFRSTCGAGELCLLELNLTN